MSNEKDLNSEKAIVDRARESMRDHQLPDDIQRRLRIARSEAVTKIGSGSSLIDTLFGNGRWLLPAGAAATLMLAVALISSNDPELMPLLEEQELAAATEMELLEDIEFLAWMLEEESDIGAPDDG